MWTPRVQNPFSSRVRVMASSKSRAVAGSMVTVSWSRRSSRPSTSSSLNALAWLAGLVEGVVVEDVGDAQGPDDGDGLDLGLAPGAEDLGDDPLALAIRGRIAGHLERDLVARPGPLGAGVADVDRVGEGRAVDLDDPGAVLLEVVADEQARGPADDLDDPPLGVEPRPLGLLDDLDQDLVAGRGVAAGVDAG